MQPRTSRDKKAAHPQATHHKDSCPELQALELEEMIDRNLVEVSRFE